MFPYNRAEEKEEVRGQEEKNRMKSVKEESSSFSLVVYSISTETL